MSTANLTDWQAKQIKHFRDDVSKCDTIQSLVQLCREFITLSSQPWYVRGCASAYKKKLDDLREGKPARLILAIDLKAVASLAYWRAKKNGNGIGVSEFLEIFNEIKSAMKYSHIIFADENETGGWRYAASPQWKHTRSQPESANFELVEKIRAALKKWNANVIKVDTMEADDVLASIAASYALAGDKVCMVCQDSDLYQVLGPQTNMYWNGHFFTRETLQQKHYLEPGQWVDYHCLIGRNDVAGAADIGETRAKQLLMTFGSYQQCCCCYKQIEKQFSTKVANSIMEFEERYPLVRRLHSVIRDLEIEVMF